MAYIGLESCGERGEAEAWVAYTRPAFVARVNTRIRLLAEAGELAEHRHHKDPLEGLEYLAQSGRDVTVFDDAHAFAYVENKGPFHWVVYEALKMHGLAYPPFMVRWYDLPIEERRTRMWIFEAEAEVWNKLEAERMADHKAENGGHDVRVAEYDMTGAFIRERSPPFHS